ncbi:MAG: hypothetical protein Q8K71_17530 [Polaromonas sp.]|nr:hypothetical protein [Polaromonas sp.]MDP3752139.1 hypothetical protein [Polaromonas sp.]
MSIGVVRRHLGGKKACFYFPKVCIVPLVMGMLLTLAGQHVHAQSHREFPASFTTYFSGGSGSFASRGPTLAFVVAALAERHNPGMGYSVQWVPYLPRAFRGYFYFADPNVAQGLFFEAQEHIEAISCPAYSAIKPGSTLESAWNARCQCNLTSGTQAVNGQCVVLNELNAVQPPKTEACSALDSNPGKGNPIYPLTGSKSEAVATGVEIGGVQLNLTYDSVSKAPGSISSAYSHAPSFGELWFTNLHRKLNVSPTLKSATASRGNGSVVSFSGDGSGTFSASANQRASLVTLPAAAGYRFSDPDPASGAQEFYNKQGQLTQLVSAQGKVLNFTYSADDIVAIADSQGKTIRFTYASTSAADGSSQRRITRITDTVGRNIDASYDAAGNLTTLIWQDSKVRQFLYENASFPWALTGVIDENNTRYATVGYDGQGRAISTEYTGGVGRYSVSYGQAPAVSVVDSYDAGTNVLSRTRSWQMPASPVLTTPNGTTSDMGVQDLFGMPALTSMSQPAGSGCAAATSAMAYDANGNVASKDDFTQKRSCYAYDSKNRPITTVEGLPNTTDCATVLPANASLPAGSRKLSSQWHPDWSLSTKVAQPLSITTSVYNGQVDPFNANAVASCAPATADRQPIAVLCKQVVQATTDPSGGLGLAATLDASVAQRVSRFTYDVSGRLLTSIDPLNRVTTQAYYGDTSFNSTDPAAIGRRAGDLRSVTNAAGHVTQFTLYDRAGRVRQMLDPKGVVTDTAYTPRGWVASTTVTPPGGVARTTTYTYDNAGQLTGVALPDAASLSYSYDAAHRLVGVTDVKGNSVTYTLDNMGNRVGEQVKDVQGNLQRNITRVYDALNRVQQITRTSN